MFTSLLNTARILCQDVVLDLINQTRDLRSELGQKDQTIVHLTEDLRDITVSIFLLCPLPAVYCLIQLPFYRMCFIRLISLLFQSKCNAACRERDDIREQNCRMQEEICDLKETLDRKVASNKIEVKVRFYF